VGSFEAFAFTENLFAPLSNDGFPSELRAWCGQPVNLAAGATHFGFAYEGKSVLKCDSGEFPVYPGMYFSVSGAATIEGEARGIVISSLDYHGVFQLGGPIEKTGRLKYIDGCTDSLLVPPVLKGDPCLNLLYFPPGIKQTSHTHPSNRIGMIVRGTGKCVTPQGVIPLFPGQVFVIRAEGKHAFETLNSDMTVIAYHPDSDFGATHENHPMINRTIVNGVPAAFLDEIRTK
jgi:quercetin dioxygenase-like cupin family protein